MRILSKFQDYYDSALAFGRDESIVFKRFTETVDIEREKPTPFDIKPIGLHDQFWFNPYEAPSNYHTQEFIIAFCGKLYRGVRLRHFEGSWKDVASFYSLEAFHKYLKSKGLDKEPSSTRRNFLEHWEDPRKTRAEEYLSKQGTEEKFEELVSQRICIAVWINLKGFWNQPEIEYVTNPCLKDFDFIKVMDPYAAFQELSMYLGGILAPESNPMVSISDRDRVQQHGFDKWSFRKLPEKKRGS